MTTLHLRCGSDIREKLRAAGMVGDFLEYSDPVCQGPVPGGLQDAAFREVRAAFIADAYGIGLNDARTRLESEERGLEAARRYARVVLWFEHDLYDQAILIRVLDRLADETELRRKSLLICIDSFPGVDRFIGLGQLEAAQLGTLLRRAEPISEAQVADARRAWSQCRAADPRGVAAIVAAGVRSLPMLRGALRRHLQDLPWTSSGLSLTQQLILQAVEAGAERFEEIFRAVSDRDPLPFLGDRMLAPIVRELSDADHPALIVAGDGFHLTELGKAVLRGRADWSRLNGIDRWLGGVHLQGRAPAWRWDSKAEAVVPG